MIRFYFGGAVAEANGDYWFGLPPTEPSLEAYLAMLDGCPIPWSVAVLGGDLFDSDLPRYALELGGHLRVGLEDYAGDDGSDERAARRAGRRRGVVRRFRRRVCRGDHRDPGTAAGRHGRRGTVDEREDTRWQRNGSSPPTRT